MKVMLFVFIIFFCFSACDSVNYQPIPDVDQEINYLGKMIAKFQRSEVWTGGNEYEGCYTSVDRNNFLRNGGLEKIAAKAKKNSTFKSGVIALKRLPKDKQNDILKIWETPIDKTWRQTGEIGNGTTDAGQLTERDIAKVLTNLVRELLLQSDEEIKDI